MEAKDLLQAWRKYISFESYAQNEIDLQDIDEKQFLDANSYEIGENYIEITFDRDLVKKLEQKYPRAEKNRSDEYPLVLCLSPIKKTRNGHEYALPMFYVPMQADKERMYRECGQQGSKRYYTKMLRVGDPSEDISVNTTLFRTEINVDSHEFYSEDNKQIFSENVSLLHMLKSLVGENSNDFSRIYSKFRQHIKNKCHNSNSLEYQTSDILVATINTDDFSQQWKEQYDYLLNYPELYQNNKLALEYLSGESEGNLEEINTLHSKPPWLGSFSDRFPLGKGQAIVMQRLQTDQRMIAAQGPPGTGKTTLFMSVLANNMVNKALAIMEGRDFNSQMVIVSTANKAVENAAKEFAESEEFSGVNWIYLNAGKNIGDSLPRLESLIEELKTEEFSKEHHQKAEQEIRRLVDHVLARQNECLKLEERLREADLQALERERDGLASEVAEGKEAVREHFGEMSLSGGGLEQIRQSYSEYRTYKEHAEQLTDRQIREILDTDEEYLDRLFASMNVSWIKRLFGRHKKIYRSILAQLSDLLTGLGLDSNSLARETALTTIKHRLTKKKEALSIIPNGAWEKYSLEYFQKIPEKERDLTTVEERISKYKEAERRLREEFYGGFGEYERKELVQENRQLYEWAREYLYQTMLKYRESFISALEKYRDFLGGEPQNRVLREVRNDLSINRWLNLVSTAYPVVTTTLFSAPKLFRAFFNTFEDNGNIRVVDNMTGNQRPFHLVLSDETGMAKIHELFPLLCYAERLLSVGDPKQLQPVIPLDRTACAVYERGFATDAECLKYSPTITSAYHRSARAASGAYSDLGDSIVLDEHRRCQPPIARAFADIAQYYGMSVETKPLDPDSQKNRPFFAMGGSHFLFYDVKGQRRSRNTNTEEAEKIHRIFHKLTESGYQPGDIGIITPYKKQEALLQQRLKGTGISRSQVGTIHKFQGVEYKVIIFSPVIFLPEDSSAFVNSQPNMLNVALSRAKELFIVAGNYGKLKNEGGHLKKLCNYVENHGFIHDTTDIPSWVMDEEDQIINTCRHLEVFDQCLQEAREEVIIVSPSLRNFRHQKENIDSITEAINRGVRVRIFYGYFHADYRDKEEKNDPRYEGKLKEMLGDDLVKLKRGTHEKILIMDRSVMFVGSFNWLSNPYRKSCRERDRGEIRRETSAKLTGLNKIECYLADLGLEVPN